MWREEKCFVSVIPFWKTFRVETAWRGRERCEMGDWRGNGEHLGHFTRSHWQRREIFPMTILFVFRALCEPEPEPENCRRLAPHLDPPLFHLIPHFLDGTALSCLVAHSLASGAAHSTPSASTMGNKLYIFALSMPSASDGCPAFSHKHRAPLERQ